MATINRFEDIQAWQKARELTFKVYEVTNFSSFNKDYGLKEQIRRAALSIMLNIAEGFGRKTDSEFRQFLFQAHGSVAEVQSALYVALDQSYIDDNKFKEIYNFADEISRMLFSLSNYLKKKDSKIKI